MNRFDNRHQRTGKGGRIRQFRQHPPPDPGEFLFQGPDACKPVVPVYRFIKGRNIDPFDGGKLSQQILTGQPFFFCSKHPLTDLNDHLFPVAKDNGVKKIRYRFRVKTAGTTADHQWMFRAPVTGFKRQTGQIKNG